MNDDSEEPENVEKSLENAEKSLGDVTVESARLGDVDWLQMFNVSSNALESLKLFQTTVPNFLEPLKNISLNLTPKLQDLVLNTENITLPKLDPDILSNIAVTSPFLDSIQSNSVLIEQQKNAIDLLHEILDEVQRLNDYQRRGIKKMTEKLNELVEEGKLNNPVFDLMKELCMEWFGKDEWPANWK